MGPARSDPGRTRPETPLVQRALDSSLVVTLTALTASILDGGGFTDTWVIVVVLVAGLDLALATALRPDRVVLVLKRPIVLALMALTVAGTVSLLWNPLPADDVLPGILMPAALAALVVYGSAVFPERRNVFLLWLALIAVLVAISGLFGVASKSEIWAKVLGGTRRPAGTVEYSTALALLQVGAIVVLLRLAGTDRRSFRLVAVWGVALGLSSIVLTQNRLLGFATVLLLTICLIRPGFTLGLNRGVARILITCSVIGGLASAAVLGLSGPGAPSFVVALLVAGGFAFGAVLVRQGEGRTTKPGAGQARRALLVLGLLIVSATVLVVANDGTSRKGVQNNLGFTHGRAATWVDSVPTFFREPLMGHGHGTYLTATAMDLEAPSRYAHNLLVESAVELGLIGLVAAFVVITDAFRLAWQRRTSFGDFPLVPYFLLFTGLLLTDWVWHMSALSAIWALAAGALLSSRQMSVSQSGYPPPKPSARRAGAMARHESVIRSSRRSGSIASRSIRTALKPSK